MMSVMAGSQSCGVPYFAVAAYPAWQPALRVAHAGTEIRETGALTILEFIDKSPARALPYVLNKISQEDLIRRLVMRGTSYKLAPAFVSFHYT